MKNVFQEFADNRIIKHRRSQNYPVDFTAAGEITCTPGLDQLLIPRLSFIEEPPANFITAVNRSRQFVGEQPGHKTFAAADAASNSNQHETFSNSTRTAAKSSARSASALLL